MAAPMHSIDDSFRARKVAAAARRAQMRRRKIGAAAVVLVLCVAGGGYYYTADQWSIDGYEGDLVEVEPAAPETEVPVYKPAFVDLAGDPMMINIGAGASRAQHVRDVPRPAALTEPGVSPTIEILSDVMLSSSERLVTTIPSSPEDFAFFQAQRSTPEPPVASAPGFAGQSVTGQAPADGSGPKEADDDAALAAQSAPDTESTSDAAAFADPTAGWGETIDGGEASLPAFKETKVEDTTEVALITPERMRASATEDFVDKVLGARSLESLILDHKFDPQDARTVGEKAKALFGKDQLDTGFVVAMRGLRPIGKAAGLQLVQISLYADEKYVGTLARADKGDFVSGVDPWVHEDLLHYSGVQDQTGPQREYRLLDAIYSTAVRNNVPSGVIGEAIMFLSRGQDLNAFAVQGDRLVLAYSATGRAQNGGSGRVLYAAVQRADKSIECFVYKPSASDDYACVTEQDQVYSLTVSNGMVTPVSGGVMTSTFGPRKHPILGVVRVHKGVDWAAPVGTPVLAAFDGTIAFHGDGQGYGNVIRIAHSGGRETRYAHLSRFADNLKQGMPVKAGDVIGYIGTTGLSTGPHLHFELYANGEAVNPLESPVVAVAAAAAAAPGSSADTGDEAVELLVDKIVRVESGGSATAKNPLSSATGLGQFIESTWLRMMRIYRPDLARSLAREELLKLRFDATLSREMVRRLAQEGEAYLRARGHDITAGRLYLCHFLGMEGASTVLSAGDGADLAGVLGQGVISANPFLTGKTVSYVKIWAENKMRVKGARPATLPSSSEPVVETKNVARTSPEFLAYKAAIAAMVAEIVKQG